jgi:catechol 2,3-dioxygenase
MQGALFFATGKYHHHIATNVWLGEGIPNASAEFPGLDYFTVKFSSKTKLDEMINNLESHKVTVKKSEDDPNTFTVFDGDKISIHLE